MEVSATLVGADTLAANLGSRGERLRTRLRSAVDRSAHELQRRVQTSYLRGPRPAHLGVRTGTLLRSINVKLAETDAEISGSVGTNVWYGRLWELGFTRHVGRTKSSRSGGSVQTGGDVTMAPRPFLQPALADLTDAFRERVRKAAGGR